ncbi:hypothetical protein XELAEV_18027769mg [Xenopus laevis]|uniref:Uncharacterized protein n=1 Tax=Xenopus laevis TaxID=8355 RepID=A0A974HJX7_XENLA|nr:hypothetical protein XELAEV_18027769mg [Xenopus laevis]
MNPIHGSNDVSLICNSELLSALLMPLMVGLAVRHCRKQVTIRISLTLHRPSGNLTSVPDIRKKSGLQYNDGRLVTCSTHPAILIVTMRFSLGLGSFQPLETNMLLYNQTF